MQLPALRLMRTSLTIAKSISAAYGHEDKLKHTGLARGQMIRWR